jgi:hypothetical protein
MFTETSTKPTIRRYLILRAKKKTPEGTTRSDYISLPSLSLVQEQGQYSEGRAHHLGMLYEAVTLTGTLVVAQILLELFTKMCNAALNDSDVEEASFQDKVMRIWVIQAMVIRSFFTY